jgi:hypothetical protein
MGFKEYLFLPKDKDNSWVGLGFHCTHKGKRK